MVLPICCISYPHSWAIGQSASAHRPVETAACCYCSTKWPLIILCMLQQHQQPGYASLAGPIVVVFASRHPEALEPSLVQLLHWRLLLDLPSIDTREDMLLGWLMEKEAALGVQDVEKLARCGSCLCSTRL